MRRYISELLPKFRRLNQQLDDTSTLVGRHWVEVTDNPDERKLYIFKNPNILRISIDGEIELSTWEFLGQNRLELGIGGKLYNYLHKFHDDKFLLLELDGKDSFRLLVSEVEYNKLSKGLGELEKHLDSVYALSEQKHIESIPSFYVGENDKFDKSNYPYLVNEVSQLKNLVASYPNFRCGEIVAAFAKNHSLSNELRRSNPKFCNDLVSGEISVRAIEKLYSVCGNNPSFRDDLSNYIISELGES